MSPSEGRPTDLAVLVVMALAHRKRLMADEIRGQLKLFGFVVTSQRVGAWLARMAREDMACVERRRQWDGPSEYALTPYGWTLLGNTVGPWMRAVESYRR